MAPTLALAALLAGCSGGGGGGGTAPGTTPAATPAPTGATTSAGGEAPFTVTALQTFEEPWAMAALPDGRLLVTAKRGRLYLVEPGSRVG
jgi:glucose/arabinose dehydrogenase